VMNRPGKGGVARMRAAPGPTTRQRNGLHPWGQLLDGTWITPDELRASDSQDTTKRLDIPPGYCTALLIGYQGRNIHAMRAYTGAWIAKRTDHRDNNQEVFIIKGSNASVKLAAAMISDFLVAAANCVNENMKILRSIVDGEVSQPCGYAQGSGFMTFCCEQQGTKLLSQLQPTSKPSVATTDVSSPEKGARILPSLVSQAEFEEYLFHAVDEGDEQMMLHQKALEAEIRAMMLTSSEDDSGRTSSDDAESVGPLESVKDEDRDEIEAEAEAEAEGDGGDQAVSVEPWLESSYEFWARRAHLLRNMLHTTHSRLDTTTIAEDRTAEDASSVEDSKEISEDEGWTVVSYKRRAVGGKCGRGINLSILGDEMKETLERLISEGKFSWKDLNSKVVANLGKLSLKERMLAMEMYEEALGGTTVYSKQGYLMGIVNRMLEGTVAHRKPASAATRRVSTCTLADFLV